MSGLIYTALDQSEASVQVTWSLSTNQRPVFITHCLVKWNTFCPALENHSNNNIHSGHIYNWTQSGYFSSHWTLYGFRCFISFMLDQFYSMKWRGKRKADFWSVFFKYIMISVIITLYHVKDINNYTLKQQDTNIAGVWSFIDGGIIALTLIGPPL